MHPASLLPLPGCKCQAFNTNQRSYDCKRTEAKRPDVQAGFEKCLSSLMVAMAGADLIHLAAGMLDADGQKERKKPEGRGNNPTRVIACGVFRPIIEHMRLEQLHPDVRVTYLPPSLHVRPDRLKAHIEQAVADANRRAERVVCLVGNCFPDIDGFCEQQGAKRISGPHCYAMLLGEERFQRIMDRCAGTYFVEQELLRNFDEYCAGPIELHDADVRQQLFSNYKVLLYVRQPSDPDLAISAERLAGFLELELDVRDAEYAHIRRGLLELL